MGGSLCKSAGNAEDLGLTPGWGRSPGEGNGSRSSNLVWRIPWTEGAWWATVLESQRVWVTERLALSLCKLETGWHLRLFAAMPQHWHPDTPLLEPKDVRKLHETKNNCVPGVVGTNAGHKIQRDERKQLSIFRIVCACPLHTILPKEWLHHLNHPSGPISGHIPTLTGVRKKLAPLGDKASRGPSYLLSILPAVSGAPIKPCLNFLSSL